MLNYTQRKKTDCLKEVTPLSLLKFLDMKSGEAVE
jgi:hypothetical protein